MSWWNLNEDEKVDVDKRKGLIDKEIELYEREKKIDVDRTVSEYRRNKFIEVEQSTVACSTELAENEHNYHHGLEVKGIVLAKLDAEIATKTEALADLKNTKDENAQLRKECAVAKGEVKGFEVANASLKENIALLDGIIKVVAAKLPQVELDKLNLNFNADVVVKGKDKE